MFTQDEFNEMLAAYGYALAMAVAALRTINAATIPTEADLAGTGTFTDRVYAAYQRIEKTKTLADIDLLCMLTMQTVNVFAIRNMKGWTGPQPHTLAELYAEYRAQQHAGE